MSSNAPSEAIEPAWKKLSESQLAAIEEKRAEARKNPVVMQAGGNYGVICPACIKPNSLSVDFCTGCSFPLGPADVQRLPDNIFLELINGKDIGATVHHRDNDYLVFSDKYPVSDHHLDIIPTRVIEDISYLTRENIPLLENLYQLGKKEFLSRNIDYLRDIQSNEINEEFYEKIISAGYNYPVSVKHLHLHFMIPPYKHDKILQYPRWHSHQKVIEDLKEFGRVRLWSEFPDEPRGSEEQRRAIENNRIVKEKIEEIEKEKAKIGLWEEISHLENADFPLEILHQLTATTGAPLDFSGASRLVLFFYPKTGQPGVSSPEEWRRLPGTLGCTPESCGFRDLQEEFSLQQTKILGISTQTPEDQQEFSKRSNLSYPLLSDHSRSLLSNLRAPHYRQSCWENFPYYKRFSLIIRLGKENQGKIEKIFFPILFPKNHSQEILQWIKQNPIA